MNKIFLMSFAIMLVVLLAAKPMQNSLNGSWQTRSGTEEYCLIAADNYLMVTHFDKVNKKFISSFGGKASLLGNKLMVTIEFHTADKSQVGKTIEYFWNAKTATVSSNIIGRTEDWRMIDQGSSNLAGNWRFLQRKDGDTFSDITPLRARRTYKLLTASRFQWAAVNIETGEFFGTGGGSYTFENDKYTETIEFFSRDSSRVGASLGFEATIKDGNWHHSGKSSKGDPMYEVWGRIK